jgi:hypothetical protein
MFLRGRDVIILTSFNAGSDPPVQLGVAIANLAPVVRLGRNGKRAKGDEGDKRDQH